MNEEKKPFWGPHRFLQTVVLIRNIITASVLSVVLWNTECSHDLCDYERINSQIAVLLAVPYNQMYYLY